MSIGRSFPTLAPSSSSSHICCGGASSARVRWPTPPGSPFHPRGRNKAVLMKRFAGAHDIDLSRSYGYADHHTDAPLLALFGHPVAVNPDARLRRIAQENQWAIEKF